MKASAPAAVSLAINLMPTVPAQSAAAEDPWKAMSALGIAQPIWVGRCAG
jgi:hypothetical protein